MGIVPAAPVPSPIDPFITMPSNTPECRSSSERWQEVSPEPESDGWTLRSRPLQEGLPRLSVLDLFGSILTCYAYRSIAKFPKHAVETLVACSLLQFGENLFSVQRLTMFRYAEHTVHDVQDAELFSFLTNRRLCVSNISCTCGMLAGRDGLRACLPLSRVMSSLRCFHDLSVCDA